VYIYNGTTKGAQTLASGRYPRRTIAHRSRRARSSAAK